MAKTYKVDGDILEETDTITETKEYTKQQLEAERDRIAALLDQFK